MQLRNAFPALVLLVAVLSPVPGRAEDAVDPRYPLSLELTGNFGLGATFTGFGTSQFELGGALAFAFPVSEKRQVVFAALGGKGQSNTGEVSYLGGAGGYRIMTFADPWRFRLDLMLALDFVRSALATPSGQADKVKEGIGLGARLAFAIQYYFVPSFGMGLQISLAAYAITPHVVFDGGPVFTLNW